MKATAVTTAASEQKFDGFSDEERAAMKDHARELKASARRGSGGAAKVDGDAEVLAKIAEMKEADRLLAEHVHAIVKASAPGLVSKLWYGMPAYAKDGKVVCFFQSAEKFKARYATLGFNDSANLDSGTMWATGFALTSALTAADEERIGAIVAQAAGGPPDRRTAGRP